MADTKEHILITSVVARMRTILTTNGYATDIGAHVEDSRPGWDGQEMIADGYDAMSVFEGTVTAEPDDDHFVEVERIMPVSIQTFHRRRDTAAEDASFARQVMSDIHNAIASDLIWKDASSVRISKVEYTKEKQHGILYAQDTHEITGTNTEIEIKYYGPHFDLES